MNQAAIKEKIAQINAMSESIAEDIKTIRFHLWEYNHVYRALAPLLEGSH